MKKLIYLSILGLLMSNCTTDIKNPDAKVEVEAGTKIGLSKANQETTPSAPIKEDEKKSLITNDLLGFWVGYFKKDDENDYGDKTLFVDDGYMWDRENKINISIDKISDSLIIGHSVVAGNDRPFKGSIRKESQGSYSVIAKEPGDNKYDGEFIFTISDKELTGNWTAYKEIDIKKRKYTLEKRNFSYNPDVMLEYSKGYIDWNKVKKTNKTEKIDDEFEEWISKEFATATNLIYEINASNTLLAKSEVENLKRGDLTIIRNTIYARHGYSFKHRPLRVFFDAQNWYIPVHTNIKDDFTDLEKKNIQLLLKYEKNAAEYYDRFGRG